MPIQTFYPILFIHFHSINSIRFNFNSIALCFAAPVKIQTIQKQFPMHAVLFMISIVNTLTIEIEKFHLAIAVAIY